MQLHKTLVAHLKRATFLVVLMVLCCMLEVGEPLSCPVPFVPCLMCRANRRTSAASPAGCRWWSGCEVRRGRSDPGQHRKSMVEVGGKRKQKSQRIPKKDQKLGW